MTPPPPRIRWQEKDLPGERPTGSSSEGMPGSARRKKPARPQAVPAPGPAGPAASPTPLLDSLGRDLTRLARENRLSAVYGRQAELRQLQRILLRKTKNNPLIVGLPGVGKTALVEGLAQLIAGGQAAAELADLRLVEISAGQLTAGTGLRGSFEARMQQLLAEAALDPHLVLFVDEIHTLYKAGAAEGGALDAANMLKPALSRGEIRCIGATTPEECARFLGADRAFERRFETLRLEEPSPAETLAILSQARPDYEAHHGVQILPQALEAAVQLSARHILDRSLPDKAFDLLDAACTRVRLPEREEKAGPGAEAKPVGAEQVAAAIAARMGLPVEKLGGDWQAKLARLEEALNDQVLGQAAALRRIAAAARHAYGGLGTADGPKGVLALFGATGTGKTAAARALAEFLFDSPEALIKLDMAEYEQANSVTRLWGAPPGYIGYDDEGTFAARLRRQPFGVVLLDEFEKAHPKVHDAFLGIFDSGRFTDARGRPVDARQAFFLLASNLFSWEDTPAGGGLTPDGAEALYEAHAASIRQSLSALFRPEFVNRLDGIVLFQSLPEPVLAQIAAREIERLNARLVPHGVAVRANPQILAWMAAQAYDPGSGARAVLRLVARLVSGPVSAALADGRLRPGQVVELVLADGELRFEIQ